MSRKLSPRLAPKQKGPTFNAGQISAKNTARHIVNDRNRNTEEAMPLSPRLHALFRTPRVSAPPLWSEAALCAWPWGRTENFR